MSCLVIKSYLRNKECTGGHHKYYWRWSTIYTYKLKRDESNEDYYYYLLGSQKQLIVGRDRVYWTFLSECLCARSNYGKRMQNWDGQTKNDNVHEKWQQFMKKRQWKMDWIVPIFFSSRQLRPILFLFPNACPPF